YTNFKGIVPADGTKIPLKTVREAFFAKHDRAEILGKTSFTARAPLLMDDLITGQRFGNMMLSNYIDEVDNEQGIQLSAVVFDLDDETRYVAFRGTDGTLVGWKEDFNFSYLPETEGQNRAVKYLNLVGAENRHPLRVGGHSKGGNLAVYASAFCDPEIQKRIRTVYSNDGPGFRQEIVDCEAYAGILPKVYSIVPDSSIIGMLLNNRCEHHVIGSSANGIFQHDGFSWKVSRNRFETAKLSDLSQVIRNALGDWIAKMNDEERRDLTDTIFSLFESTGMDTFSQMSGQKLKSFEAIVTTLMNIPRERQQEMYRLLTQLGQSGSQAAGDYLKMLFGQSGNQAAGDYLKLLGDRFNAYLDGQNDSGEKGWPVNFQKRDGNEG
ncbi:MAG: DUF2974 domain-containing protein, partial [Clostridia bacterium]|nr:DUF2974 domain-containing protein [Clostridia bacterium]